MKPEPKPIKVVCSNCGMDWEAHGEQPTVDKCVELLKAELARRPAWPWKQVAGSTPSAYWSSWNWTGPPPGPPRPPSQ